MSDKDFTPIGERIKALESAVERLEREVRGERPVCTCVDVPAGRAHRPACPSSAKPTLGNAAPSREITVVTTPRPIKQWIVSGAAECVKWTEGDNAVPPPLTTEQEEAEPSWQTLMLDDVRAHLNAAYKLALKVARDTRRVDGTCEAIVTALTVLLRDQSDVEHGRTSWCGHVAALGSRNCPVCLESVESPPDSETPQLMSTTDVTDERQAAWGTGNTSQISLLESALWYVRKAKGLAAGAQALTEQCQDEYARVVGALEDLEPTIVELLRDAADERRT